LDIELQTYALITESVSICAGILINKQFKRTASLTDRHFRNMQLQKYETNDLFAFCLDSLRAEIKQRLTTES
jgi:hypothetical protein